MAETLQCQKCVELSRCVGIGKLLCDGCEHKPCSICHKLSKTNYEYKGKTYKALILGYDGEPLCLFCKEHQCYLCGEYDGDVDWDVTYAGKPLCEECGVRNWCNECGDYDGGCDNRCPECDVVCDVECGCEVECVKCRKNFYYEGWVFRHRKYSREFDAESPEFKEGKRICSDCWGKETNSIECPSVTGEKKKTPIVKKKRQKMSVEYVYGLGNEALPGIVKIGGCKADPVTFLNEASAIPNPLSLPFEWKLVSSKRVSDLQKKLDSLYTLIDKKRIGSSNCFRIAEDEFNKILDVIDGVSLVTTTRSMQLKFKDKEVVRHCIGMNVWSGVYDSEKNVIVYKDESYKSPSGFALAHYKDIKSDRTSVNGWAECQIEKDGAWVYIS